MGTVESNLIHVPCTYLGKAFSGDVFSIEYSYAEKLFEENRDDFSNSGIKSFLSSLTIPASYFKERNQVLQSNLVEDTKNVASEKKKASEILLLVSDNTIQYASPYHTKWESPEKEIGLNPDVWNTIDFDTFSGYVKYVAYLDRKISTEYCECVYLRVPIFYSKPMIFDLGVFKSAYCSGLVDAYSTGVFRSDSFNSNNFNAFTETLLTSGIIKKHVSTYQEILNFCSDKRIDSVFEFISDLKEVKKCHISKALLSKIKKHMKLASKGNTPPNSPKEIETMYDFLDTLVFYVGEMKEKSMSSKHTIEKKMFRFFKDFSEGKDLKDGCDISDNIGISLLKLMLSVSPD